MTRLDRTRIILSLAIFFFVGFCQVAFSSESSSSSGTPLSRDRAYLGFSMGLEQLEGGTQAIRVVRPVANSPAQLAGLQDGDLITSVNSEPVAVSNLFHLLREMDKFKAGEVIRLQIRRGKEDLSFDIESGHYSAADFDRLNRWLVVMEGRQKPAYRSAVDSGAQCSNEDQNKDYASQRWSVFLGKTIKGAEPAVLTVRRPSSEAPLAFEISPSSLGLPSGFVAEDLPSGMKHVVEQLQPGDEIRYQLESRGQEFHIKPLGDFPEYIKSSK